jgi:hypothetical protein
VPQLSAIGLGTLYSVYGAKQSSSTNIGAMQTLAWLAKDNRAPEKRKVGVVAHPHHPIGQQRLETPEAAYSYAADIFGAKKDRTLELLGLTGWPISIVPVPSSSATRDRKAGDRWPALALANALAVRSFGSVLPCLRNKKLVEAKTVSGKGRAAHEIADNITVGVRPAAGRAVLFVDDVITWGKTIAAMNHAMGWSGPTAALCIAFTHDTDEGKINCYQPKVRVVAYDPSATPWTVTISRPELPKLPTK